MDVAVLIIGFVGEYRLQTARRNLWAGQQDDVASLCCEMYEDQCDLATKNNTALHASVKSPSRFPSTPRAPSLRPADFHVLRTIEHDALINTHIATQRLDGPVRRLFRFLSRRLDTALRLARLVLLPLARLAHTEIAVDIVGLVVAVFVDGLVVNLLRPNTFGPQWWVEASTNRFDHLAEPEDVERVEDDVGGEVDDGDPERKVLLLVEGFRLRLRILTDGEQFSRAQRVELPAWYAGCEVGVSVTYDPIHIAEDPDGRVDAPDETAAEEGAHEKRAVDGLIDATRQVQFVAEPVDVEERTAELVKQEDWGREVDEWTL